MKTLHTRILHIGLLTVALFGCPAFADSVSVKALKQPVGVVGNEMFNGKSVENDALESYRGRADVEVKNTSVLDGALHDNKAFDLITGNNLVTEGSFAGASGFSTVIQNSGNNVLIQNSSIINLQVK